MSELAGRFSRPSAGQGAATAPTGNGGLPVAPSDGAAVPKKKAKNVKMSGDELRQAVVGLKSKYTAYQSEFINSKHTLETATAFKTELTGIVRPLGSASLLDDMVTVRDMIEGVNKSIDLIKRWKKCNSFSAHDLIKAAANTASAILDLKEQVHAVSQIFGDYPIAMKTWLDQDGARQCLRQGQYSDAFDMAVHKDGDGAIASVASMHTDRYRALMDAQISVCESASTAILNQLESETFGQSLPRLGEFFGAFIAVQDGYVDEAKNPMRNLNKLVTMAGDVDDAILVINNHKRGPIYRAFMYHNTSKLGGELLRRAETQLAGTKKARDAQKSFLSTSDEVDDLKERVRDAHDAQSLGDSERHSVSVVKHVESKLPAWWAVIKDVKVHFMNQTGCTIDTPAVVSITAKLASRFRDIGHLLARTSSQLVLSAIVQSKTNAENEDVSFATVLEPFFAPQDSIHAIAVRSQALYKSAVAVEFFVDCGLDVDEYQRTICFFDSFSKSLVKLDAMYRCLGLSDSKLAALEDTELVAQLAARLSDEKTGANTSNGMADFMESVSAFKGFCDMKEGVPVSLNTAAVDSFAKFLCDTYDDTTGAGDAPMVQELQTGLASVASNLFQLPLNACSACLEAILEELRKHYVVNQDWWKQTTSPMLDLCPEVLDHDDTVQKMLEAVVAMQEPERVAARLAMSISEACLPGVEHTENSQQFQFNGVQLEACRLLHLIASGKDTSVSALLESIKNGVSIMRRLARLKKEHPSSDRAAERVRHSGKQLSVILITPCQSLLELLKKQADDTVVVPLDWEKAVVSRDTKACVDIVGRGGYKPLADAIAGLTQPLKEYNACMQDFAKLGGTGPENLNTLYNEIVKTRDTARFLAPVRERHCLISCVVFLVLRCSSCSVW